MDADPLQLLWILKGELESIAKDLQPPPPEEPEESDDIVTDNGLSKLEEESHPNEEDEKAQELESTHNNCNAKVHLDPEQHGLKMEELIRDYLTPAIKQLSRKKRKNKKNGMMQSQSQFGSPPPAISTTLHTNPGTSGSPSVPSSPFLDIRDNLSDHLNHHNNGNHQFVSSPHIPAAYDQSSSSNSHALSHQSHHHNNPNNHNRHSDHNQNYHHQPHQQYPPSHPPHRIHFQPGEMMMDHVSNFSEQFGSCCRRFITSLVCGCGLFQTIGILFIFITVGAMFMAYRATEVTHILKEMNRWKELSIKRVEYEMASEQKLAELQFDLDVDLDKLKEEHQHREKMEIIEAKKELTREFIEKNTRRVTTTSLTWMGTETEEVSQTIFGEEDIAYFQHSILYYGFDSSHAIDAPERNAPGQMSQIDEGDEEMEELVIDVDGDVIQNEENSSAKIDVDTEKDKNSKSAATAPEDSFDAI